MRTLRLLALLVPTLLACVVLDVLLQSLTGGLRVVDPFLVLVVWHAAHGRRVDALLVAAAAGLVQDSLGSVILGVHYLSKLVVAYLVSLVAPRLVGGQALTHSVLLAGATVLEILVFAGTGLLLGRQLAVQPLPHLVLAVIANTAIGTALFVAFARRRRAGSGGRVAA